MRCMKCNCLMSHERFYDVADAFEGWRCICCGDIVDDVILSNRSKKDAGRLPTIRARR
jgi:hypothetical protein